MGLINTRMQPLRAQYSKRLDKNEIRASRYGVLDAFQRDTASPQSILSDQVKKTVKRSFGNSVVIPVLDAETVTIGNTRTCTVAASENTSKLVTLVFVTYSWGFTMTPAQHFNNDIDYQNDWDRKLQKYLLQFASVLDTGGYNTLNTAKNKVWATDVTNQYSQVGNALQIPGAEYNNFYNTAEAIMEIMDFYGQYNVIANTMHQPLINEFINQGAGNSKNTSFQFMGYNFGYSNRVSNQADVKSTAFIVPEGNLAIVNRNEPDALAKSKAGDGTQWEEVALPSELFGPDFKVGSKYRSRCADNSTINGEASAGLTASMVEEFQWSTDVCYVTSYNSDPNTRYSPIVKAEFLQPAAV